MKDEVALFEKWWSEQPVAATEPILTAVRFAAWNGWLGRSKCVVPKERTFILLATEKGLTPVGKLVNALQAFVVAEEEWRKQKAGMPEGTFNDPLTDAYVKAKAALEQFSMYTDNIAVASQATSQPERE